MLEQSSVWFFLRRRKALYGCLAAVLLVAAVLEALSVGALFPLVTTVLGGDTPVRGGGVLSFLESMVMLFPSQDRLVTSVALMVGFITAKSLAVLIRDYLIAYGGAKVVHETKQELFARLTQLPYSYFIAHSHGDLSYRLTTAPQSLGLMLLLFPSILAQGFIVFAICLLLMTISWPLTLGIIGAGGLLYGLLRQSSKRVSHVVGKRRTAALSKELGIVVEFMAGIKEIFAANAADRWMSHYCEQGRELRVLHVQDSVWQSVPGVLIEWVFFVLVGVMAVMAHQSSGSPAASIPMMAVYAYALYRLIRSVSLLSAYKLRLGSQLADVGLLHRTLEEPIAVSPNHRAEEASFTKSVIFDHVSFVYPGRQEPAICDINLAIEQGQVVALVGRSGSGKTTLVNLLLRLYDQSGGAICVDGRQLAACSRSSWLRLIGYVSQEVFMLNGTVRENIRFGLVDYTEGAIEEAARAAYAHEFIAALPHGYETIVGDRGMMLSGGQRQRLAIARALLRKPQLLIFDEATSALDPTSEAFIQQAIRDLARDHTIILVAHRLSTVRFASKIVVLENGRIVEVGTHQTLLAMKGQYSMMMSSSVE